MLKYVQGISTVTLTVSCSSRLNQLSCSVLVKSYVYLLFE